MSDRIAPYLTDAARPSRLLTGAGGGTVDSVRPADRTNGPRRGQNSSTRCWADVPPSNAGSAALGSPMTVDQFRIEQVLWGATRRRNRRRDRVCSRWCSGKSNPVILVLLIIACAAGGVLGRDWWLSQAVSKRDAEIIAEFPVVAEMLALAVTAGEGPMGAIDRITRLAQGPLVQQLAGVLAETRSGTPFLTAITRTYGTGPGSNRWPGSSTAWPSRSSGAHRSPTCCAPRPPTSARSASGNCWNPAAAKKSP